MTKKNMFAHLFALVFALSVATNLRAAALETGAASGLSGVGIMLDRVWLLHI